MLFFIPLCDAYTPVIFPYFRPFMLTLGVRTSMCSLFSSGTMYARFFVMLAKSPILSSAVSLNLIS